MGESSLRFIICSRVTTAHSTWFLLWQYFPSFVLAWPPRLLTDLMTSPANPSNTGIAKLAAKQACPLATRRRSAAKSRVRRNAGCSQGPTSASTTPARSAPRRPGRSALGTRPRTQKQQPKSQSQQQPRSQSQQQQKNPKGQSQQQPKSQSQQQPLLQKQQQRLVRPLLTLMMKLAARLAKKLCARQQNRELHLFQSVARRRQFVRMSVANPNVTKSPARRARSSSPRSSLPRKSLPERENEHISFE